MGERYDAVVTLAVDGAVPVVAVPEGGTSGGLAVIRTATGLSPAPDVRPAELEGRLLTLGDLRATDGVTLPPRTPARTLHLRLAGSLASHRWTPNRQPLPAA